jgi:threonine dehydrogenase-like Zn-dependent dehydrogenase
LHLVSSFYFGLYSTLRESILKAVAAAVTFSTTSSAAACPACEEVAVDVAVLGGGAAGSYVAAQLTDVYGKNVIVVDSNSRMVRTSPSPLYYERVN